MHLQKNFPPATFRPPPASKKYKKTKGGIEMIRLKRSLKRGKMKTGFLLVLLMVSVGAAGMLMAEKAEKKPARGYLGVMVSSLSQELEEESGVSHGVVVAETVKNKAAEKAGIKKGDIILYFNGEKIRRPANLVDAVRDCTAGDKVAVKLSRGGKEKTVNVTLDKYKPRLAWVGKDGNRNFFNLAGGAYLGVRMLDLNEDLAAYFDVKEDGGALITQVEKDSPAEKAGLKAGDVITSVNGENIKEPGDVGNIISELDEGDKVALQVIRHKKKKDFNAELAEREGFGEIFMGNFGNRFRSRVPHVYHFSLPHLDEHEFIMEGKEREKIKERLKEAREKEKDVKIKLKKLKKGKPLYI
jgi:predicted metalloprotease with PDZ domain